MEHLRFCGSLNIACGHANERGFCTLTRCPVVLEEMPRKAAAREKKMGSVEKNGKED